MIAMAGADAAERVTFEEARARLAHATPEQALLVRTADGRRYRGSAWRMDSHQVRLWGAKSGGSVIQSSEIVSLRLSRWRLRFLPYAEYGVYVPVLITTACGCNSKLQQFLAAMGFYLTFPPSLAISVASVPPLLALDLINAALPTTDYEIIP